MNRALARRFVGSAIGLACVIAAAQPARGSPLVEYVGARVGYVVGRGWTLGPEVGVGDGFASGTWFDQRETTLVLGLSAAGDVSFGDSGQAAFRLHVGAELAALYACPAVVVPLGGGLSWSFERGYPVALGGHVSLAALLAALHPQPTSLHPPPSPTFLVGPAYRAAFFPESFTQNELAIDARLLDLPGHPGGLGSCGRN
jgi:hypothetical protein